MSEYILDLTNARLPSWWPESAPLLLPIKDGEWYADYDVIEDRLPGFRGMIKIAQRKNGLGLDKDSVMPFGFDQLPTGSKLTYKA